MKYDVFPIRKELEAIQKNIPEINPAAVWPCSAFCKRTPPSTTKFLRFWSNKHQLSEGKLSVMMVLYEHPEGVAPSILADNAGVSRATISVMLQRMMRDGLVSALLQITATLAARSSACRLKDVNLWTASCPITFCGFPK
jgi:hypothetical protein